MKAPKSRKVRRGNLTAQIRSLMSQSNAFGDTEAPTDAVAFIREIQDYYKRVVAEADDAVRQALALAEEALAQADRVTALWDARELKAAQIIEELVNDAKLNYRKFQRMQVAKAQQFLKSQKAGKRSGAARRKGALKRNEEMRKEATRLLASGYARRDLAGILAKHFSLTPTRVRNIIGPTLPTANKRKRT